MRAQEFITEQAALRPITLVIKSSESRPGLFRVIDRDSRNIIGTIRNTADLIRVTDPRVLPGASVTILISPALRRQYPDFIAGMEKFVDAISKQQHRPVTIQDMQAVHERVNSKVIEPGYTVRRQLPNGMIIQAEAMKPWLDDPDPEMRALRGVVIRVIDPEQKGWYQEKYGIAEVRFFARQDRQTGEWNLRPTMLNVNEKYRRQGIASAMYNFARSLGNDIVPGTAQTDMGKAFWAGGAGLGRDAGTREVPPAKPEPAKSPAEPVKEPSFRDRWRRILFPKGQPA